MVIYFQILALYKERNGTNLITIWTLRTCARSAQYHGNRVLQMSSFRDMSGEFSLADVVGSNCYEYNILVRDISIPLDLSLDDKFMLPACGCYDSINVPIGFECGLKLLFF